jgi:fido (protein-threonine AMPylation protein)
MENTKYQYKTLKVTTKQEYKKAEKLLKSGWIFLNVLCDGEVIQFCKISKK